MILLDLMGGVAMLLWGLHMVQSGLVRAFGADLRRFLRIALANRIRSFLAGIGVTTLLQSSTATALMVTSFSAEGMVGLVCALAVMLGANVGTTLVVQVLSWDVAAVAPVLLVAGVTLFRQSGRTSGKGRRWDRGRGDFGADIDRRESRDRGTWAGSRRPVFGRIAPENARDQNTEQSMKSRHIATSCRLKQPAFGRGCPSIRGDLPVYVKGADATLRARNVNSS